MGEVHVRKKMENVYWYISKEKILMGRGEGNRRKQNSAKLRKEGGSFASRWAEGKEGKAVRKGKPVQKGK